MVRLDMIAKERDVALAKVKKLEAELAGYKSKFDEKDPRCITLGKKSAENGEVLGQVTKAWRKLAEDKVNLEAALRDASGPGLREPKDLHGLSHHALVDRIAELEKGLVGSAWQSFENAFDQLKVMNTGIEVCVDGIHFLKFVEDGVIVTPRDEDDGHVGNARPVRPYNFFLFRKIYLSRWPTFVPVTLCALRGLYFWLSFIC